MTSRVSSGAPWESVVWEEYGRAHGKVFGDAMPATSMVEVRALIDPALLVEVEAVAYRPGVGEVVP